MNLYLYIIIYIDIGAQDGESNGLESEAEDKEALEDVTYNADLFIANQEEVNTLEKTNVYFSVKSTLWRLLL